jgi:hypothetical protein
MGATGFEPVKAKPTDLQSAPFNHSGKPPIDLCLFWLADRVTSTWLKLLDSPNQRGRQSYNYFPREPAEGFEPTTG